MSDRTQLGFKPFCITCEFFDECSDVPLVDDPTELRDFDEFLESEDIDPFFIPPTTEELIDSFFISPSSEKPESSSSRLDWILDQNPDLKKAVAFLKLTVSPAEWNSMNVIPTVKSHSHHEIGVTDLESILGHTLFVEALLSKTFSKKSIKTLLDSMGPEILIATLMDKVVKIFAENPKILVNEVLEFSHPLGVPRGR